MMDSAQLNSVPFKIGDWMILPDINRLVHASGKHNIGSRTMQVLISLAENQGHVVTKETLMKTVWNDVVVTEDSLMKSISMLRKLFDIPSANQPKIETIRSVGYVLDTPVEPLDTSQIRGKPFLRKHRPITYAIIAIPILAIFGFIIQQSQKNHVDGQIIKVTDSWSHERVPRFSPDGAQIMFAGGTGGNNNLDICIKSLKTNQLKHIENSGNIETDPIWSPDGKNIAFFRNDGRHIKIIVRAIDSGLEKAVADVRSIVNLSAMIWSADGGSIIYSDLPEGQRSYALHRVDLRTKEIVQLTKPHKRIIGDSSPRISPNGKKLVFIRSYRYSNLYYHIIPGYGRLIVMDLENGEEKEVKETPQQITGVSWINDDYLAYSYVYKNYAFRIEATNLTDGISKVVYESSKIIRNLDVHAGTNRLVFENWDESYNIWRFSDLPQKTNFSGRHMTDLNSSWHPAFHEKSNRLAFVSKESGFAELWVHDLKSNAKVQMTVFDGAIIRYPQWSPDGNKIVYEINQDRNDDIYVLDMETGLTEKVIEDLAEEKFPAWSEDGTLIYYGSNQTGEFQIRQKNLLDGTDVQLTTNGGIRALPYDGHVYYCFPYSRGIWKIEDDKETMIVENFIPNDITNWQLVKNKLFYISRSRYAKPELYYLNLETGTHHHYQSFSYQISYTFGGLAYNANDSTWLITLNDMVRSDIHMMKLDPMAYTNDHQIIAAQ